MCNACRNLSKIYDPEQKMIVSRITNRKTGAPEFIVVREFDDGEVQSCVFPVNYCPWCGEKLEWAEPEPTVGKQKESECNGGEVVEADEGR